jgi:hypothetical protein
MTAAQKSSSIELVTHLTMTGNLTTTGTMALAVCKATAPIPVNPAAAIADLLYVPNIVSEIDPISFSIDPLTRKVNTGSIGFSIVDTGAGSMVRAWLTACHHYGARVDVLVGVRGMAVSDYAPVFVGSLRGARLDAGEAVFTADDLSTIYRGREVEGLFAGEHPAESAFHSVASSHAAAATAAMRWPCGAPYTRARRLAACLPHA